MKKYLAMLRRRFAPSAIAGRLARRFAPRTVRNIEELNGLMAEPAQGRFAFITYERELQELRRDVDALRRDIRRVAELYDVVFEWARRDAAARGVAPEADRSVTDAAVARFEESRGARKP